MVKKNNNIVLTCSYCDKSAILDVETALEHLAEPELFVAT